LTTALASGDLFVGNGLGVATAVAPSGDITMTNAGVFTVAKVDGVTYPSGATTVNTVPVITGANTITYETVPNAALTNSSVTIGSTSVALGGTAASLAGLTNITSASHIFSNGSNSVTLTAPSSGVTAYTLTLPATAPTSNGQVLSATTAGIATWVSAASGSVTSVGMTGPGGIFSVTNSPITGAGTLSETVTGTAGGIPYFSTTGILSSSGTLNSGDIIVGGGVSGPSSTTVGLTNTAMTFAGPGTIASTGTLLLSSSSVGIGTSNPTKTLSIYSGTVGGGFNLADGSQSAGKVLTSDASGNASWATVSASASSFTGTLAVANGGTGQASNLTQGGLVYGSSTTAMATSAAGSAGQVLTSGGTGAPSFVTTTLSGTALTFPATGAIATTGALSLNGGSVGISTTTASTTSTTGALTVAGGEGIAGALNVGTSITAGTSVTSASHVFSNGSNPVTVTAPSSGVTAYTLTLPATAPTSNGQVLSATTTGIATWINAATGAVTSVGMTGPGGIFSVANSPITTAGTLSETVAGTSGGIPYFSNGTTLSSSTALGASDIMIGGGAGAAPSTTTVTLSNTAMTFAGTGNITTAGTLSLMGGNVGIGTTAPANALDIYSGNGIHIQSGTPSSTAAALYNNSGTLMWNGSAISGGTSSQWTTSGSNIYYATGGVGIGTTTQIGELNVVWKTGDTASTATFGGGDYGGNSNNQIAVDAYAGSNSAVSGQSYTGYGVYGNSSYGSAGVYGQSQNVGVYGNGYGTTGIGIEGITAVTSGTGSYGLYGNNQNTGYGVFGSSAHGTAGWFENQNNDSGIPVLIAQQLYATATGDLFQAKSGTNTVFNVTYAGNVGIGTANPQTALDVSGSVNLEQGYYETVGALGTLGCGSTNITGFSTNLYTATACSSGTTTLNIPTITGWPSGNKAWTVTFMITGQSSSVFNVSYNGATSSVYWDKNSTGGSGGANYVGLAVNSGSTDLITCSVIYTGSVQVFCGVGAQY
jgi:hypothetical protein